jgi:hypothetical protein
MAVLERESAEFLRLLFSHMAWDNERGPANLPLLALLLSKDRVRIVR